MLHIFSIFDFFSSRIWIDFPSIRLKFPVIRSNNTVENTGRHIRETCTSRCNDNGNRRAQLRLMSDGSRYVLYNASASVAQLLVLAPDFTPVRRF